MIKPPNHPFVPAWCAPSDCFATPPPTLRPRLDPAAHKDRPSTAQKVPPEACVVHLRCIDHVEVTVAPPCIAAAAAAARSAGGMIATEAAAYRQRRPASSIIIVSITVTTAASNRTRRRWRLGLGCSGWWSHITHTHIFCCCCCMRRRRLDLPPQRLAARDRRRHSPVVIALLRVRTRSKQRRRGRLAKRAMPARCRPMERAGAVRAAEVRICPCFEQRLYRGQHAVPARDVQSTAVLVVLNEKGKRVLLV